MDDTRRKEELLYEAVVNKTKAGKFDWKNDHDGSFSLKIKNWQLLVSGTNECSSLAVYKKDDGGDPEFITRHVVMDPELYKLAELHCSERQKQLEKIIKALEEL